MPLLPTNVAAGQTGHVDQTNQAWGKLNDLPNVVRDYGADNTGATDASSVLQSAIDATPSDGGIVFLPRGIYDIGTVLDLSSRSRIHLIGEGTSTYNEDGGYGTVLRTRTNGMTLMQVDSGALLHGGPTIEGINFRAKTGHTGATLLKLRQVNRWRVHRCGFRSEDSNANTGIELDGGSSGDNAWWTLDQPLIANFATGLKFTGANVFGGVILGGQFLMVGDTAVGIDAASPSHIMMFGTFFDNGIMIRGNFSGSNFFGLKLEGPPSGVYAVDLGTSASARRNYIQAIVGGKGLGGHGIRFNTTNANDNLYHIATENMGGGTAVTDNGSRNIGVVLDGGAARTRVPHYGSSTPTGGLSGDIAVGNSKIWVNDAGTWKSATVA